MHPDLTYYEPMEVASRASEELAHHLLTPENISAIQRGKNPFNCEQTLEEVKDSLTYLYATQDIDLPF